MPTEVLSTIHQLVAACKKYKVLVFIDKDDNMIDDHNRTQCRGKQNIEITGVE